MSFQVCRRVLIISCVDVIGIVANVTGFLSSNDAFIVASQQYSDPETGTFFLRIVFRDSGNGLIEIDDMRAKFSVLAERFGMTWRLADANVHPRVLIGVSKAEHCLNDLLHRWRRGALPIEIVGIFSNHEDLRSLSEGHNLPFYFIPVDNSKKSESDSKIGALVEELSAELVVLARYMQVLGKELCASLQWRCINIHHSFLPSFRGAQPYHQAYRRGVKLIGATAHYVTPDLDEGPIIEQDIERVNHGMTVNELVEAGRDIETRVLARAVRWCAQRRVLPNGGKTVVFS